MFLTPGSRAARKRVPVTTGGGAGTPGGVSGNIQFNSAGTFSGVLNSSWDSVNSLLSLQVNTLTVQSTASAPYLLIDNLGNLIYGASASHLGAFGLQAHVQTNMIDGTTNQSWSSWQASAGGPYVAFEKSRGATVGAQGLVSSGDEVGLIAWAASDGNAFRRAGGLDVLVDGTPAAGSMPGRMTFYTTPTGTVTPVERARIDNQGLMYLGNLSGGTFGSGGALNIGVNTSALDAVNFLAFDAATGFGPNVNLEYTRGTVPSSNVIVQSSDGLGFINFQGANGVASYRRAATVWATVEPTPSAAVVPARLCFGTVPSGGTFLERMRIDSVGNVTISDPIGTPSSNFTVDTFGSHVQAVSNDSMWSYSQITTHPVSGVASLMFAKTRGTLPSSNVIVVNGDRTFEMWCYGNDGANYRTNGRMAVEVDGVPAVNNIPGRWIFATASSTTVNNVIERLRLDGTGNVIINSADATAGGSPIGLSVAYDLGTFWGMAFTGYGNNNFNCTQWFRKTKGTVPSSHVLLSPNTELYVMSFQGSNGTSFQEAASIDVWVDGTPTAPSSIPGSMPGRFDFVTNPGTTGSLVRLSIDSIGNTWLRTAGRPGIAPVGSAGSVNGTVSCYNHQVYGGL